MGNNFEVYKILSSGVPVLVKTSTDLRTATIVALQFAIEKRGHYTVCAARNIFEPILDLSDFETMNGRSQETWLTLEEN